jgi:hypothetical protein
MGFSTAGLIIGGISAAAAAGGAYETYSSGQQAAAAQGAAEDQSIAQQNTAFQQRQAASQQQLQSQTALSEQQEQAFSTNQEETQAQQMAALGDTQSTTNQLNQDEQAIATDANNKINAGIQSVNNGALPAAQASLTAAQSNLNAPVAAGLAVNNPLGAADTGPTAQAMAGSDAASAKYVSNYGDAQAKLAGYAAPITAVNQAATNTNINLMPTAAADVLLKGSAPSILAPSQLAYTQAGDLGQAINTSNASNEQAGLALASAQNSNADDLANLQQQDAGAITQNTLTQQQQRAAQLSALGSGLTTIGNTGLYAAGRSGAFTGLSSAITGAASNSTAPDPVGDQVYAGL